MLLKPSPLPARSLEQQQRGEGGNAETGGNCDRADTHTVEQQSEDERTERLRHPRRRAENAGA